LWGRIAARIEPEWAETLGAHLVKRTYSEPHWEKDRAAVMAFEKVTLYGVPLVAARKVNYGRIDPELSRELFIRHALVEGEWRTHHAFFAQNRELLEEVEELEHRARRRDILVDDETLFTFYDARIPTDVVSGRHFDSWWKRTRRTDPDLLNFTPDVVVSDEASAVSDADYPDLWRQGDLEFALTYQFEPGTAADGVTLHLPLAVLNRVDIADFDWQVPGLRLDLVTALIRSLPKPVRRHLVPAPDFAGAVLARLVPHSEPLLPALEAELSQMSGVAVPSGSWDLSRVPDHLRMTFQITDDDGAVAAAGKDLAAIRHGLLGRVQQELAKSASGLERAGVREWDFGDLPRTVRQVGPGGHELVGHPALVDEGDTVAVRVLATEAAQRLAMVAGTRRLLLLTIAAPVPAVIRGLSTKSKLALSTNPHGGVGPLLDDCLDCAVDALVTRHGGPAWDSAAFAALRDHVRGSLGDELSGVLSDVERVLTAAAAVSRRLSSTASLALLDSLTDIKEHLAALVFPGFVTATGAARLPDLARYLRALDRRLETLPDHPARDRERMARVAQVEQWYAEMLAELPAGTPPSPEFAEIRWMIEELRVSLFAQNVGTAYPISEKRIVRAMETAPL
jgi:ATP-dependent helicase HrpA